jgi:hypothetical protein
VANSHLILFVSFSVVSLSTTNNRTACFAKHANDKAAKWAAAKRPKKKRPSDINRKPIEYELHSLQKPPEYTIQGGAASPAPKPEIKAD